MNLVLSFGGSFTGVSDAVLGLIGDRPVRVTVLPAPDEFTLAFRPLDDGIGAALRLLEHDAIRALQFFSADAPGRLFGGVSAPRFNRGQLEHVSGFAEGDLVTPALFEGLLLIDALRYVSLSVDDSPDLEMPEVTVDNFPWDHWLLLTAAVRTSEGCWQLRDGPQGRGEG